MEIRDNNTEEQLGEEKEELEARQNSVKAEITTSRRRLQESSQVEFITDLIRPPEKWNCEKIDCRHVSNMLGTRELRSIQRMRRAERKIK